MQCSNCQTENSNTSKYCIRCGTPLVASMLSTNESTAANQVNMTGQYIPVNQPPVGATSTSQPSQSTGTPNFFALIVAVFIKPITTIQEELPKFSSFKNSAIMVVISAIVATLFSLFSTIIATVYNKRCSLFGDKCEIEWEWDRLENFEWLDLTIKPLIGFLATMAILAGVFFAVSRIFKQSQTNFSRILAIVALAFLPIAISLLASALGLIQPILGTVISMFATIYSLCLIYEGINIETELTGNKRIYFFLASIACILIVFIVASTLFGSTLLEYITLPSASGSSSLLDFTDIF